MACTTQRPVRIQHTQGEIRSYHVRMFVDAVRGDTTAIHWLSRMCPNLASNADDVLWWSAARVGQLCVSLRLRTVLGDASATLSAIERLLNEIAKDRSSSFKTRCVLQLVHHLEVHMFNASHGCASLKVPDTKAVQFFRNNRKVCKFIMVVM